MDVMEERAGRLREFFELGADAELIAPETSKSEARPEVGAWLSRFNIEWHIIPSAEVVPLDDSYFTRLYPMPRRDFAQAHEPEASYREQIKRGHRQHQGHLIGVETTRKPRYLPGNRQFYGSLYGHDATLDPFAHYMGLAEMVNGTRYEHNYLSLREFLRIVGEDWRARSILPAGYRVSVCPPAVFNLVGTVFHPEWSDTESLELGFYRDERGNATCYAVGSNAPGDFSYIDAVEGEGEWSLMGFRLALVRDEK